MLLFAFHVLVRTTSLVPSLARPAVFPPTSPHELPLLRLPPYKPLGFRDGFLSETFYTDSMLHGTRQDEPRVSWAGKQNPTTSGYSVTVLYSDGYLYFRPLNLHSNARSRARARKLLAHTPQCTPEHLKNTGQADLEGQ